MATNHHPTPHAHSWYDTHPCGSRTNCADYCGHRDDSRPDLLPKRECKIPDFNWLAVPIEVAASIDALAVCLIHTNGPNAGRPRPLVCLPQRDLSQLLFSCACRHGQVSAVVFLGSSQAA